jgi:hypothetical protein
LQQTINDKGETSAQSVLLIPIVMALFFMAIHVATLSRASHVAQAVSLRGANMASSSFGPNGIAASLNEMESMAFDLGTHLEEVPHISVSGKMATVTVTVRVRPLVPFMSTHITRVASVPLEVFMLEEDR